MTPADIFEQIRQRVSARPELVDEVAAIFQFDVRGEGGGSWLVDLRNAPGAVRAGGADDADCVIAVDQKDFVGIMTGAVDPQMAFMLGRVKISGNFMLATKLRSLM